MTIKMISLHDHYKALSIEKQGEEFDRRYALFQRTTGETFLELGSLLRESKKKAGHGNWLPWLKLRGIPERNAQRWIEALERAEANSDLLAVLGKKTLAAMLTLGKAPIERDPTPLRPDRKASPPVAADDPDAKPVQTDRETVADLKKEIVALERREKAWNKDRVKLSHTVDDLRRNRKQERRTHDVVCRTLNGKVERLEDRNEKLRDRDRELMEKVESLETGIALLEGEAIKIRDHAAEEAAELGVMKRLNAELKEDITALKVAIDHLRKEEKA